MARKWKNRIDQPTTRGEHRDHALRKQSTVGQSPNYRSNNKHPDYASEIAEGQRMLDDWAASLKGDDSKPRSR